jgi:oxygen-independent coproporphyrinogen-3 oxidase
MTVMVDSLYLHFPFCRHLCNYCDFFKRVPQNASEVRAFEERLTRDYVSLIERVGNFAPLKTVYIGGGTPSLWGEEGARFLERFFRENRIELTSDCEFTLEVNPGSFTKEGIAAFESVGVNRFSLGVQSLDARFLPLLDRVHSLDEALSAFSFFSERGSEFSADFMLGLPFSEKLGRNVLTELNQMLGFAPAHLSLYILTVKNNYKHYQDLPDDEWVEREFLQVSEVLRGRGYEHYEVSNFSLPGHESKHNLRYWQGKTVAAMGPSATGFYAAQKMRLKGRADGGFEEEHLSESDLRLERLYLALRLRDGVLASEHTETEEENRALVELLSSWRSRGVAESRAQRTALTPKGFLIMDSLMGELFTVIKSL